MADDRYSEVGVVARGHDRADRADSSAADLRRTQHRGADSGNKWDHEYMQWSVAGGAGDNKLFLYAGGTDAAYSGD